MLAAAHRHEVIGIHRGPWLETCLVSVLFCSVVRYGKFGHTRNSVYAVMNKREREGESV